MIILVAIVTSVVSERSNALYKIFFKILNKAKSYLSKLDIS